MGGASPRAARLAACALLLLVVAARAEPRPVWHKSDALEELWRYVELLGGDLSGVAAGRSCPDCPRGLLVTRDVAEGGMVLRVPMSAALPVSEEEHDEGSGIRPSYEYARELLVARHTRPAFNATWRAWLAVQPAPGETQTAGSLAALAAAGALQQADLEHIALEANRTAWRTFQGAHADPPAPPLPELAPGADWGTFLHWASLVESRSFGPLLFGARQVRAPYLLPAAELVNHSDDPSGDRGIEDGQMVVTAKRALQAGEEVTFDYQPGVLHRPDMSLLIYGFVAPQRRPLLAACDLPAFDASNAYAATPLDDAAYEDPSSGHITRGELDRLAGILARLPTTEEQDQALLDGGTIADWRERAAVLFRVMRKRALRQTIARLGVALQEAEEAGGGGGGGEQPAAQASGTAAAAASEAASRVEL